MAETFRPSSGRRKIRQDSSPIVTEITDESCTVRNNFIPYAAYDTHSRPKSRRGHRVNPGDRPKTRSYVTSVHGNSPDAGSGESVISTGSKSRPMTTMPESRKSSAVSYRSPPSTSPVPQPPSMEKPLVSSAWKRPKSRCGRVSAQEFNDVDDSDILKEASSSRSSSRMSRPPSTLPSSRRPGSAVSRALGRIRPTSAISLSKYSVLPGIGQTRSSLDDDFDRLSISSDEFELQSMIEKDVEGITGMNDHDIIHRSRKSSIHINIPHGQKENAQMDVDDKEDITSFRDDNLKYNTDSTIRDYPNNVRSEKHSVYNQGGHTNKLTRNVSIPTEPQEGEDRILLAVKLPYGDRLQRHFRLTEPLQVVLDFAEVTSQTDFTGHELVSAMPKRIFKDLTVTLGQSQIHNRTVLYIQLPED